MLFADLADAETIKKIVSAIVIFFCTTALSFVAGRWWGRYQAKKQWQNKQFLGRVIVSLNSFTDGWLKIRTVFERSLEEIFPNPVAVEKVRAASLRTTPDNPLLPIAKEDRWYLLNFVLNAVAERFSNGVVCYDAGQPLKPVTYMLFLTCEVVGPDRFRKVRAMMLRKDLIEDFPYRAAASPSEQELHGDAFRTGSSATTPVALPKLEQAWHRDRIATLARAAEIYRKEPDQFLAVEIYV